MADRNVVSQEVKLNLKNYLEPLRRLKTEMKSTTTSLNQELQQNARHWDTLTNNVKMSVSSMSKEIKALGKETMKNVLAGATAGLGAKAAAGVNSAINEAAKSMLSLDEVMARLNVKFNLTSDQSRELSKTFAELAKTGVSIESIGEAFQELGTAVDDLNDAKPILDQITKFASTTAAKNANPVEQFVRQTLQVEGKKVTAVNSKELLDDVMKMFVAGRFQNTEDAMSAFAGVDAASLKNIGMSNRSVAGILAGASGVGNKENSLAAMNDLIKRTATGPEAAHVLAGVLGGNQLLKNGQLDMNALRGASAYYKKSGLNEQTFKMLLGKAGISEQGASGLVSILENVDQFADKMKKFEESTVTADSAADRLTDNVAGKLGRVFGDITGSFYTFLSDLAHGNFSGAFDDLKKNWKTILGSGATALGGAGLGMLSFQTIASALGLGAAPAAAPAAAAAAEGAAATTGINMLGVGSTYAAAPAATSAAGASTVAAAAPAVAAVGIGLAASQAFQYLAGGGFESDIKSLIDEMRRGPEKKQSIFVEVDSKDPGFVARPKAVDNQKNPRGP